MERPERSERLARLGAEAFDLLVIGGGIVGAGVARDAAMRGLRTALIEQYDFAFGTSSRSSRLLHGGIRYLAQGRIGLVREASREKHVLQRIAPHLAAPLPFVFLTYKGNRWPRWKLSLGVKLYDWLCGGGGNLGKSKTLSADETRAHLGGAAPEVRGLTGAVRYFDGLTNDARLVLDTLRSAERHGAVLANYTRFESAERDECNGELWKCSVAANATVRARCVVCAAGPWAQGLGRNRLKLRLTKGVHLVVERARLPVPDAIVMTEGPRILFAIPWGERVILGTTDTDFSPGGKNADAIAGVSADAGDIAYVLRVANATFPAAKLTEADVLGTWAGLRPLIADPNGSPSDISRSHEIVVSAPGWIEVGGGKLTTYRVMAEQAVDGVLRELKRAPAPSSTAHEPLLSPDKAANVSAIVPPAPTREAVEHYCSQEWAEHLDDVMLRRGGWHFYFGGAEREKIARAVCGWMAQCQGWDGARADAEWRAYAALP
jgi:glycerol-3-phosphate dehydrogenase